MSLPTFRHEWQHIVNRPVAHRMNGADCARQLFFEIVSTLTSFPLNPVTVRGSSNGTTAALDGVNRLSSTAAIVASGGAHSWIVLRWASGVELCFDFNDGAAWLVTLTVSFSAGFTGGTTTARPTATDETTHLSGQHFTWGNATAPMRVHAAHSEDGRNTYLFATANGAVRTLFLVGEAVDTSPDWTAPTFAIVRGSADIALTPSLSYANADRVSARHPSGNMPLRMSFLSIFDDIGGGLNYMASWMAYWPSSWTSEFPASDVGFVSLGGGLVAPRGKAADLWRCGDNLATGRVFRSADLTYPLANFAGFLVPWPVDQDVQPEVI